MIRIAAGESLEIKQSDVNINGWAMESRIYAEDPRRGFLPSCGRLVRYQPPSGDSLRLDSGVREGAEIPVYYDPMIAKLITHADDRSGAIAKMRLALDEFYLQGIAHNMHFLSAIFGNPRFADGQLSTNFIDEEFSGGYDPERTDAQSWRTLACVAAVVHQRLRRRARGISGRMSADAAEAPRDWVVSHGDKRSEVTIIGAGDYDEVLVDGVSVKIRSEWVPGERLFRGTIDENSVCAQIERAGIGYRLAMGGVVIEVLVLTPRAAALNALMLVKKSSESSRFLLAPMPGLLVSVAVQSGDEVDPGQELAVVEAMKMENVLRADEQKKVASVLVSPGESVSVDQPIIEFV
jgi:propionyl-CoA carboxylase alpha chain